MQTPPGSRKQSSPVRQQAAQTDPSNPQHPMPPIAYEDEKKTSTMPFHRIRLGLQRAMDAHTYQSNPTQSNEEGNSKASGIQEEQQSERADPVPGHEPTAVLVPLLVPARAGHQVAHAALPCSGSCSCSAAARCCCSPGSGGAR